ncbi:MAG TPA: AAA family ATPase [Thermoanaerobaculia bacterium]|nr:AAA family ATPase [Thermoanaerobaculia bacterium]
MLVIVAGPNGAGKTTFVQDYLQVYPYRYLSADAIAAEISPEQPSLARIEAGREFSRRVKEGIAAGEDLILESTLSGRSVRQIFKLARDEQYAIKIVFVFLENAQTCVDRVKERVKKGGHDVPEIDIRRRFYRSKVNFWETYRLEATEWNLSYNSNEAFQPVAIGEGPLYEILNEALFALFMRGARREE